ncbi:MAG: hypothetical protein ACFBSF_09720 [Leptolyngbyaceae cyanobacterium]
MRGQITELIGIKVEGKGVFAEVAEDPFGAARSDAINRTIVTIDRIAKRD